MKFIGSGRVYTVLAILLIGSGSFAQVCIDDCNAVCDSDKTQCTNEAASCDQAQKECYDECTRTCCRQTVETNCAVNTVEISRQTCVLQGYVGCATSGLRVDFSGLSQQIMALRDQIASEVDSDVRLVMSPSGPGPVIIADAQQLENAIAVSAADAADQISVVAAPIETEMEAVVRNDIAVMNTAVNEAFRTMNNAIRQMSRQAIRANNEMRKTVRQAMAETASSEGDNSGGQSQGQGQGQGQGRARGQGKGQN